MTKRRAISSIGIALALIVTFAALPLQAQSTDSPDDFKYDGADSAGHLHFSWKAVDDEDGAILQFTGGGITNVWLSVWLDSRWQDGGRTKIKTDPLTESLADLSGKTLNFRVKVEICTEYEEGECVDAIRSDWAYLEVTF